MSEKSSWKNCNGGWSVNLPLGMAQHESGFKLEFTGHPSSRNFDVQPSGIPKSATVLEWASLLREGTDEYRRAFVKERGEPREDEDDIELAANETPRSQARKPVITVKRKRQIS